jgi:cytochrome c peroxidase
MNKQNKTKHRLRTYPFILALTLTAACGLTALTPSTVSAQLASLKTIPVPEPLNIGNYIVNRTAAIQLGKALFWDMQVGSDGVQACATCHFHAGADNRTKNQLNPGTKANDALFGNNLLGLPAPAGGFGPNVNIIASRFPFHKLLNKDLIGDPLQNPANVASDCNDVMSSQGVALNTFVDIVPGNPVDLGTPVPDPVFNLAGVNIRRVEPRNTPSVVNAVYNFTNFWDGRANNIFNGNNPFGPSDPNSHAIINAAGALATELVRIRQSSLASQAVGPPLSEFEMSWQGRTWPKVGKKMLSLRPLAQQTVHPGDSVLGPLADTVTGTGLNTTYEALIKQAFRGKYWGNNLQKVTFDVNGVPSFSLGSPLNTNEYTQIEANFSLFFGLAVQLYESTLVANDSPFDRFMEGAGSQTLQENLGMKIFSGVGGCGACHLGAEMTDVSVGFIQGANPINGVPQPLNKNPLNTNEFMTFFTGTALYDNGFHNICVRPGGDTDPLAPEFLAANEDACRGADSNFNDPVSGVPFPLSFGLLGLWKNGDPTTPLYPPWTAAFYTPYVPPLPIGFRPTDTNPYAGRVANFGSFKTPSLRNVELTGPYFHNGGAATLRQVVDFYTRGMDFPATNVKAADPALLPIGFLIGSSTRKNELVAFLLTLTDPRVKNQTAPFDHPEIFVPIDGRAPVSPGNRAGLLANARFKQIPAVGVGGLPAAGLPPLGTFLGFNPFKP